MIVFWFGVIVLLAAFLLPLFIKSKKSKQVLQSTLNKQIYLQRVEDLKLQMLQKEITEQEFQTLESELQAGLLEDLAEINEKNAAEHINGSPKLLITAFMLAIIFAGIIYFQTDGYEKNKILQAATSNLPELTKKLEFAPTTLTAEDLEQLSLALRIKLKSNKNDLRGWILYGNLQMNFGYTQNALEAYSKAITIEPNDKQANLVYAAALAKSQNKEQVEYANFIYHKLNMLYPDDLDVLSKQAFVLLGNGDKLGAINTWEKMLKLLPSNSPRRETIERTINILKENK